MTSHQITFLSDRVALAVMMMINRNSSFYARYLVPVEITGLITYHIPTIYLFIVFNNCNLYCNDRSLVKFLLFVGTEPAIKIC